jgi:hypothetical protein
VYWNFLDSNLTESTTQKCECNLGQDSREKVVAALKWCVTPDTLEVQWEVVRGNKHCTRDDENGSAARPDHPSSQHGEGYQGGYTLSLVPEAENGEHDTSSAEQTNDLFAVPGEAISTKVHDNEKHNRSRAKQSEPDEIEFLHRMPQYLLPVGFGEKLGNVHEQESAKDDSTGRNVDVEALRN